ncbi:hypothetical protein SAY87_001017 [Trapa incisa]|uniref:PLATZ transcription factor family protein n=1 Tax=Trapa incisa TaxID=236973 RepID=A0AAN7JA72_9MYRT|nr:hypothetical protein SAY87_001017 [Trapa incisa]
MVDCEIVINNRSPPDWISVLLHQEFFNSCFVHKYLRKSEQNLFCIDCKQCHCKHCSTGHGFHRCLQICKYVYQDVVRIQEMQRYLDCSKIQTYKINGEKAVHLNPRPISKDTKPSTKSKSRGNCEACRRYLQDTPNRFCSIACKLTVEPSLIAKDQNGRPSCISFPIEEFIEFSLKENDRDSVNSTNEGSSSSLAESSDDAQLLTSSSLKPIRRLHKRKGLPCRAPLH